MAVNKNKLIEILTKRGVAPKEAAGIAEAIIAAQKDSGGDTSRDRSSLTADFGKGLTGNLAADAVLLTQELKKASMETEKLITPLRALIQQTREFRIENEEFVKAGFSSNMFNFKKTLEGVADESYRLTGNFKAFGRVTQSFRDNFKGLGFASETFRQSIMKTGVALQAAGFNMDDFAGIVDSATFAFNKSEGQINDIAATLIKTSREFAIAPKELTENFQFAQKNFAYTTGRFMDNFLQLQKMSRMTGVGFQQLAQSFGENMDTFEGSAQMAGRLNQILGRSMFNSIDLLNKTEAERAKIIREGIMQRFGGRVGELQKFELKAIGASLNMSVEETRRFLRGEAPKAAKDLEKLKKKTPAEMAAANLGTELGRLEKSIDSFRRPTERNFIKLYSSAQQAAKSHLELSGVMDKTIDKLSAGIVGEESVGTMRSSPLAELEGESAFGAAAALSIATATGEVAKSALTKVPIVGELLGSIFGNATSAAGYVAVQKIAESFKNKFPGGDSEASGMEPAPKPTIRTTSTRQPGMQPREPSDNPNIDKFRDTVLNAETVYATFNFKNMTIHAEGESMGAPEHVQVPSSTRRPGRSPYG